MIALRSRSGSLSEHGLTSATVNPSVATLWSALATSPGAFLCMPPVCMRQALTAEETDRLSGYVKPQIEQGHGRQRIAIAYLSARRPAG